MKQTKKGGGTLREYRVFGYRVTVESFSDRTSKRWQVSVYDERLELQAVQAVIDKATAATEYEWDRK